MQPEPTRKPGEAVFALFLAGASLVLFWSAYGISGFEALSSPGAIPMAASAIMVLSAIMVAIQTFRLPAEPSGSLAKDILPRVVISLVLLMIGYAFLLKPLGFLPTSLLFLVLAMKALGYGAWWKSITASLAGLALIYLVFRLIFSVLMPNGIVPEGEVIAWVTQLLRGGR